MSASLGTPLRQFEAITVLHYDEGEEITDHFDFIDPNIPGHAQEVSDRGDRIVGTRCPDGGLVERTHA